jgi:hypothetical protein
MQKSNQQKLFDACYRDDFETVKTIVKSGILNKKYLNEALINCNS